MGGVFFMVEQSTAPLELVVPDLSQDRIMGEPGNLARALSEANNYLGLVLPGAAMEHHTLATLNGTLELELATCYTEVFSQPPWSERKTTGDVISNMRSERDMSLDSYLFAIRRGAHIGGFTWGSVASARDVVTWMIQNQLPSDLDSIKKGVVEAVLARLNTGQFLEKEADKLVLASEMAVEPAFRDRHGTAALTAMYCASADRLGKDSKYFIFSAISGARSVKMLSFLGAQDVLRLEELGYNDPHLFMIGDIEQIHERLRGLVLSGKNSTEYFLPVMRQRRRLSSEITGN